MPRRKDKIVYLDTNAVLDFVLKRNNDAALLVESIKSRKWKIITSTFTMVEMSDWKKRDLFIRNKLELNWGMDTIFGQRNRTDLGHYEFEKVEKWLLDVGSNISITFVDLEGAAWEKVREISSSTNLLAKDAIHFGTALVSSLSSKCDILVTNDGDFINEAKRFLQKNRLKRKLGVLKAKDFCINYPPKY